MPGVMPFLTYYEYLHNTQHLDQRKIHAKNPFCYVLNRINNKKNIEDAYNNHDNEAMLNMGWNPYIKPTAEAFKRAYERQMEFFEENYSYNIYDISNFYSSKDNIQEVTSIRNNLVPIFITLLGKSTDPNKIVDRIYSYKDFENIGISFYSELKKVYSYELTEDYTDRIHPVTGERERITAVARIKTVDLTKLDSISTSLHVMVFFVTPEVKKSMKEGIDTYIDNQDKSKYGFDTIMSLLNSKSFKRTYSLHIIMAMYLDSIFRVANLYDKKSDKVYVTYKIDRLRPNKKQDRSKRKIYIMYNGNSKGYKPNNIDKKIKWLQNNVDRNTMNFFDDTFDTPTQPNYYDFDTYIQQFSNESAKFNSLIENMRDILTPTSFIQESTFDYTAEEIDAKYKEAVLLLSEYNETELEGIKKQCKELFILYNICTVILKNAKTDPEAKILDSIKTSIEYKLNFYIRFIKNIEPEFDFNEYCKLPSEADHDIKWKNSVYIYSSNDFKYNPNIEDI